MRAPTAIRARAIPIIKVKKGAKLAICVLAEVVKSATNPIGNSIILTHSYSKRVRMCYMTTSLDHASEIMTQHIRNSES